MGQWLNCDGYEMYYDHGMYRVGVWEISKGNEELKACKLKELSQASSAPLPSQDNPVAVSWFSRLSNRVHGSASAPVAFSYQSKRIRVISGDKTLQKDGAGEKPQAKDVFIAI